MGYVSMGYLLGFRAWWGPALLELPRDGRRVGERRSPGRAPGSAQLCVISELVFWSGAVKAPQYNCLQGA